MSSPETVTAQVNASFLRKADRLFRNDDASIWTEILQNARRAGATAVNISIEEHSSEPAASIVTVHDNGRGIDAFQNLLTLGSSGWEQETQAREDPAGMGFYSLCRSVVEVQSGNRSITFTPSVFSGEEEAHSEELAEALCGTRIRFTRESSKQQLVTELAKAAEFYPIVVRLDGTELPRNDFLAGALYRETIDGIEVGFATAFKAGCRNYPDLNWNFYGARIHGDELSFTGFLVPAHNAPLQIHARFNVLDTARVKLQLPDRKGIIEDQFYAEFLVKARAAAYRFFLTQERHALPYKCWKDAKALGIELSEAVCLLTSWHATAADDNGDPTFGTCELHFLEDRSRVVLVDQSVENRHTLEAAILCGGGIDGDLYFEDPQFAGYTWYDSRPRIVDTEVFLDGVPYNPKAALPGRPKKIELAVTIEQMNLPPRDVLLNAFVHVDSDSTTWDGTCFVAVENSPWDNPELNGPFSIIDFIFGATFCPSDDADADSWQTQSDRYEEEVRREINAYFRGPKATLLAILQEALDYQARALADDLGITEIRFSRAEGVRNWSVSLDSVSIA